MSRRFLVGLAPLPVIAALAVTPVAAQAVTQHWYQNTAKATEGEEIPTVTYGNEINLSQELLGEINCKTVGGGVIDNPVGGGAGVGRTNSLAFYECKPAKCEEEVRLKTGMEGRARMTAQNNPAATEERRSQGGATCSRKAPSGASRASGRKSANRS